MNQLQITDITEPYALYVYQAGLTAPFFFPVSFQSWSRSFFQDKDGSGRALFHTLRAKAAQVDGRIVGFIQYGMTDFGFDDRGECSDEICCRVIRSLYFDEGYTSAGKQLLDTALAELAGSGKIYAFFHYFGMSCYFRHGKLYEGFGRTEELLRQAGFQTEHENVYYSAQLQGRCSNQVELAAQEATGRGQQQTFDFLLGHRQIGGCEIHRPEGGENAYLRWIYICDGMQNKGLGTQCMVALQKYLFDRGVTRLDTDTALSNLRAQHYYEKNGFTRKGITRSYYLP